MMSFIALTMICSLTVFADKRRVAPHLSLVNVADLNKVLRSEVFVSKDRQLRAVPLILNFEPILNNFQEVGHVIRAGDLKLCKIDIYVPRFLAREDIAPVELPPTLALPEVVALREEIASSRLSLGEKINQFKLEEEGEVQADPVEISDTEGELDRTSGVCTLGLIFAQMDDSSEEEEEEMSLNPRKSLKDLLAGRTKAIPNLKKKRKEQELEEGEVVRQETKKQKMA